MCVCVVLLCIVVCVVSVCCSIVVLRVVFTCCCCVGCLSCLRCSCPLCCCCCCCCVCVWKYFYSSDLYARFLEARSITLKSETEVSNCQLINDFTASLPANWQSAFQKNVKIAYVGLLFAYKNFANLRFNAVFISISCNFPLNFWNSAFSNNM